MDSLENHPDPIAFLRGMLLERYDLTGNSIAPAILVAEKAISTLEDGDPCRADRLNELGRMLLRRYSQTGNMDELDAAALLAEQVISEISSDNAAQASALSNLGQTAFCRYQQSGRLQDLNTAVLHFQKAVHVVPENDENRESWLLNLGTCLGSRYECIGTLEDLEAGISITRQAIATITQDHPDRVSGLHSLGNCLLSRYERKGDMEDLEEATTYAKQAVSETPEGHQYRASRLHGLGINLANRYERTGNMEDLDAAISFSMQSISTTADSPQVRAVYLNSLGNRLSDRYERTGNIEDLQKAITYAKQATALDHPDRPTFLDNLGTQQYRLYRRLGSLEDLEMAISNAVEATTLTPEGHPGRAGRLCNLGSFLSTRYLRTRNTEDLESAILRTQQAIPNAPISILPKLLNNLGNDLMSRYSQTKNVNDLKAAISNAKEAISILPEGHPHRTAWLGNLGKHLLQQYNQTRNKNDLEAAISNARQAASATPEDHPDLASQLHGLGAMFLLRSGDLEDVSDLYSALDHFERSARCSSAIPLLRVRSARRAIRISTILECWKRAYQLAREAVRLLPHVCGRYLRLEDQQHAILQTLGLATDACSLSLKMGHVDEALQQVEFGRGVILGYLIDNRSDLSTLEKDHPALATELEELRYVVSRPIGSIDSINSTTTTVRDQFMENRREVPQKLENCLQRIRQKDGYERFLLEPLLDELLQGAEEGPIVIVNVTDIGSDAMIVSLSGVVHIELPEMTPVKASFLVRDFGRYSSVGEGCETHDYKTHDNEAHSRGISTQLDMQKYGAVFLSWLWRSCVKPILEELPAKLSDSPELPRIWWIGTGVASSLPFHAAGDHSGSIPIDVLSQVPSDILSQAIPSYTPTIKALIHARSCIARSAGNRDKQASVLVVAMPKTPGQAPLPGVEKEMAAVRQAIGDTFTVNQPMQPSVEQVMEGMKQCDIIHFACHGSSDTTDPSNSHLLLQKTTQLGLSVDKLTLRKVSNSLFQRNMKAWIAYLSACSTAEVRANQFADEALHIVSAFQVAGFGHVIGSLWSVGDDISARVAGLFYECLSGRGQITNRSVAEALRKAILEIRPSLEPREWAPYIHSGA